MREIFGKGKKYSTKDLSSPCVDPTINASRFVKRRENFKRSHHWTNQINSTFSSSLPLFSLEQILLYTKLALINTYHDMIL